MKKLIAAVVIATGSIAGTAYANITPEGLANCYLTETAKKVLRDTDGHDVMTLEEVKDFLAEGLPYSSLVSTAEAAISDREAGYSVSAINKTLRNIYANIDGDLDGAKPLVYCHLKLL